MEKYEGIGITGSTIRGISDISGNNIKETFQSNFSIKEDINTPESVEKIRKGFSFYKTEVLPLILSNQNVTQKKEGYHGLYTHTQNVVFRGICYAVSLGEDPIPVVFACACHDLARKNDNRDIEHGKNAVPIAQEIMNNEKFNLSEEQKSWVIDAISSHTEGKQTSNYVAACLRDADRTRLSWERGYCEDFFNTELGKNIASREKEAFIKFQNQCVDLEGKNPDTITPEEFNLMLMNRDDIKYLDEHLKQYKTFSSLSPEMVSLYDKIIDIPRIQEMSEENRKSFLEWLFSNIGKHCDVKPCLDIIPSLISEGYKLDIIKRLSIREDNKNLIKSFLDNNEIIGILRDREDDEEHLCLKIGDISKFINVDNFKYLEDCIRFNIDEYYLSYFNEYTKDIIGKYLLGWCNGFSHMGEVLDRLHRRGHTLQSVDEIFGDEKITQLTSRLLEFKDFNKFKDVGIKEYINLSTEDKKIFLSGFISALTPYDVLYPDQSRGKEDFKNLQDRMKIFEEIKWENDVKPSWSEANIEIRDRRLKKYNDILKILLNGIPDNERVAPAYKRPSNINYRKEYREKNKIPPLVDDIEKILDIRVENIKGRSVKVGELDFETDLGVSTHRFSSILSLEALEVTDSNMFLAIGTNGGSRGLNVTKNGYALIVKSRNIGDLYVQGFADIDSGTGSRKNLYNFEHVMLPFMGDHTECISLVPNAIKKELNLSQEQYTKRIEALGNVTTLQEVGEKDKELELATRRVLKNVGMYEGLITPTVMGISIGEKNLNDVDDDILDYCVRRDIPLVRIKYPVKEILTENKNNPFENFEVG